jgi:hypothetical protein
MTKTGSPPRWLELVNEVIVAMKRRGLVVGRAAGHARA